MRMLYLQSTRCLSPRSDARTAGYKASDVFGMIFVEREREREREKKK